MKKILYILITFIIAQTSFCADSKSYLSVDYGKGYLSSEKLDSLNAGPAGSTFGFGYGSKLSYMDIGFFYKKFNFSKDINHDGAANKLEHSGNSIGVELNGYVSNYLSIKLGYSYNSYEQKFATAVSDSTLTSMKSIYGTSEKFNTSNAFYGLRLNFFNGKKFDTTISVINYPLGSGASITSAQVGFIFYMNSNFSDLFRD